MSRQHATQQLAARWHVSYVSTQPFGGHVWTLKVMNIRQLRRAFALAVLLSLALFSIQSRALSQEQKVRGRIVNDVFGFAVTIPEGRTATRVQHIASDAQTLFISVSLPKPVSIEIHAELDPEHDEEFDAQIKRYIDHLRKLGCTEIVSSGPQPASLGNLAGSKYRIHVIQPDGEPNDVIWISGKRTPQPDNNRLIVVSITLGGKSADVAEYESEMAAVVKSFEWIDLPAKPRNKVISP